jgi:ankyrin repeat protein
MNWEHSVLNRIYKTLDFKANVPNLDKLKDKTSYIKKVNELIDKYNLRGTGLYINPNGALHYVFYLPTGKKSTFYFDYTTNYYFLLFTNFFEIENKFINYEDYTLEGYKKYKSENDEEITEMKKFEGREYTEMMKTYLLKLLFIRENNKILFNLELKKINDYLKFRTFIIGHDVSHYDVVLLSIIHSWKNKEDRVKYFESGNLLHLLRWSQFFDRILDLDYSKIEKIKDSKLRENLSFTHRLNSNQELVKSLKDRNIPKLILLLEQGENVNSRELDSYKSLAHLVCRKGDLELLKILIEYGCDLESLDDEDMTPIYEAIFSRNLSLCEFLIEEKKINLHHLEIQNRSPFYWAACAGDINMINYLLSKPGVDVNNTSKIGRTPLSKACWNGNVVIVTRLCQETNLKINLPDKNGRYPLHNAVWGEYGGRLGKKANGVSSSDSPECAELLINAGHLLEVEDSEGYTPLMIAASTNGIKSLELLINSGANPNHLNKYKATAVIEATRYGNAEPVKVLLQKANNVDIDVRDIHGVSAIEYAVCFKREESFQFLLNYKEQKNLLKEEELISLLTLSIQSDSKFCFRVLIDKITQKEVTIDNSSLNKNKFHMTNYIQTFKEMIDRVLNLSNYYMFNYLCQFYFDYIELFIFTDIQLFIKAMILDTELEAMNFEENKSKQKKSKRCTRIKENQEMKCKREDESTLSISSTNLTNGEISKNSEINCNVKQFSAEELWINKNNENELKEVRNEFRENVDKIYKIYLNKIEQGGKISHSFLKLLITLNDYEKFNEITKYVSKNEDNFLDDSIKIEKKYFEYIIVDKKRNIEKNAYKEEWESLLIEISENNLLTLSVLKTDDFFFSIIIHYKFTQNFFFKKNSKDQNILHVLFQFDNIKRFESILSIIEKHYPNMIHLIIEMLDNLDENGLTPLDIIMKNKLFDLVEKYTNVLNLLREKHKINVVSHNHTFYKIFDYELIQEQELVNLPIEYKNHIDDSLRETNNLLKKFSMEKDFKILDRKTRYLQYDIINDSLLDFKQKILEIIQKIKKKNLSHDFKIFHQCKQYKFHWVDTEESLSYCVKHLSNYNFIGVDLEFHGSNSEKDGIVCVLQISSLDETFAIDTLKLRSEITNYLKPIFENEKIIKIFHGCDNDIVWLITNFQIFTKNIFDTGRAYLVFQKFILNKSFKFSNLPSLNFLSRFFLQMEIDKSYQKSDWRIRPLTQSKIKF